MKPESLKGALDTRWNDDSPTTTKRAAATRVKFLYRAQMLNQIKGYALLLALALEAGAFVFVALAVKEILAHGTFS